MARFATTPCATQLQPALQVVSAPTIHAVGAVFGILQQAVRTVACTAVAEAIRFQRRSASTSARARRRHRRHRRQRRFTAAIAAARTVPNRGVIRMRSTALIAMRSALKYPLGTIARLTVSSVLAARSYHDSGGDANRWTLYIIPVHTQGARASGLRPSSPCPSSPSHPIWYSFACSVCGASSPLTRRPTSTAIISSGLFLLARTDFGRRRCVWGCRFCFRCCRGSVVAVTSSTCRLQQATARVGRTASTARLV